MSQKWFEIFNLKEKKLFYSVLIIIIFLFSFLTMLNYSVYNEINKEEDITKSKDELIINNYIEEIAKSNNGIIIQKDQNNAQSKYLQENEQIDSIVNQVPAISDPSIKNAKPVQINALNSNINYTIYENFTTDVFQNSEWNRTDNSVAVNTTSGLLDILPNSQYDDFASIQFPSTSLPVTLEYRSILKSGGLDYVLPVIFLVLENGTTFSIARNYNINFNGRWGFSGIGWLNGYGPNNENEWWDVKLLLNGSLLTLFTKPSLSSNYTFVLSKQMTFTTKINELRIGQDWDAWVQVDWIKLTTNYLVPNNTQPTASNLQLTPFNPKTDDNLVATWIYSDLDNDTQGQALVRWYTNGIYQASFDNLNTISSIYTQKGEVWNYTLRVFDGKDYSIQYNSSSVTILNTVPTASNVQITSPVYTTDNLVVSWTYFDADNDIQVSYLIRWYKDSVLKPALNDSTGLSPFETVKGEIWFYTLQVFDGEDYSSLYTSPQVTILNTAPTLSNVQLTSPAYRNSNLTASWTYNDADSDSQVSLSIQWYRNGVLNNSLDNLTSIFNYFGVVFKGDSWYYVVDVYDGEDYSSLYTSPTVIIQNTAPTASNLTLTPLSPVKGTTLNINWNYDDTDGDPQLASVIHWYKNGALNVSLDNSTTIPSSNIFKGDVWYFTLQVFDGTNLSSLYTSSTVTVSNTLPDASNIQLTSPAYTSDGITASWTFYDADSDNLASYTLLWYNNGVLQPALNNSVYVSPSLTSKGEIWNYSLRVSDGENFSIWYNSPQVTILNTAPTLSNVQLTDPAKNSSALVTSWTFSDADNDLQQSFGVTWYKNNIEQSSVFNLTTISNILTNEGEVWNFTVWVSDGFDISLIYVSQSVTIIPDNSPVFTSVPTNFSYIEGDTGYFVSWNVSDNNPTIYEIYHNDQLNVSNTWISGSPISFAVDGLLPGIHNVTIVINDGDGYIISHTVFVDVKPVPVPPVLTIFPLNHTIVEGNHNISWIATDDNPTIYILLKNSYNINSSLWSSGVLVDVNVSYLTPGLYNFTILIFDVDGLSDTKTFFVNVISLPSPPTIIVAPQDFQYPENTRGNLSWVSIDTNPDMVILYLDGVQINSTSWNSGSLIDFTFEGLLAGFYNFTVVFSDTDGLTVQNTVFVTVTSLGTPPQIVSIPSNINHIGISVGNITWVAIDDNPTLFTVYRDGTQIVSGAWSSNTPVSLKIGGLNPGQYNFTIIFSDNDGLNSSSSVIVTVDEKSTSVPIINTKPADIKYTEGSTGNFLIWMATDDNPANYTLYRDGALVNSSIWTSGNVIAIQVDGLSPGIYQFEIIISDLDGLSISDSVTVEVIKSGQSTTSNNILDITTPGLELEMFLLAILSFLLVSKVKRRRED